MRQMLTAAGVGALLFGSFIAGPKAGAQAPPGDLAPISIYTLDGASIDDSIGDPNLVTPTGKVYGDPAPTSDRHGNETGALLFDGVDDYVETNEESNINPLSFSVWFRADDISREHSIVDSDRRGGYGHSLIIGYDDPRNPNDTPHDGSLDVQFHDGFWDTGVKITAGEWTQAFVTYSDDEMRLYVGSLSKPMELVAQQPYDTSSGYDGSKFRFGRHNTEDPQWFKGAIDDVKFYDEALTPTEIEEKFEEEKEEPTPDPLVPPGRLVPASWGDVHIRTPDGLVYDLQIVGEYQLTRDSTDQVVVQARQVAWEANPRVSVNKAAHMYVAGDSIEVDLDAESLLLVNGVPTELPTAEVKLPQGGTMSPTYPSANRDFTVLWPDRNTGARVIIRADHLDIGVARLGGDLVYEGLLGNFDRDPTNDMQVRDGETLTTPATGENLQTFADSWLVGDESRFSNPMPAPEAPAEPEPQLTLADLDEATVAAAEETCSAAGVSDPLALGNCTYDVAATGDEDFVASAQTFQEAVEELPEGEYTIVSALEDVEVPGETGPPPAVDDPDQAETEDEDGLNPIVFVGIGLLILVIVVIVVMATRRKDKTE